MDLKEFWVVVIVVLVGFEQTGSFVETTAATLLSILGLQKVRVQDAAPGVPSLVLTARRGALNISRAKLMWVGWRFPARFAEDDTIDNETAAALMLLQQKNIQRTKSQQRKQKTWQRWKT